MRKLKFRAWCHEDKVMVYDLNSPRLVHGELKDELYEFMQYTGLKDKNGKEIWEGDIVYSECMYSNVIVEYKEQDAGYYPFSSPSHGGYEYDNDYHNRTEVLGNIHENHELLEK